MTLFNRDREMGNVQTFHNMSPVLALRNKLTTRHAERRIRDRLRGTTGRMEADQE